MSDSQVVSTGRMDRFGTIASVACLVHCALTPIVFSLFAFAAPLMPSEGRIHRFLAVPVCLIAIFAMQSGYRSHRNFVPAGLMILGLSFILLGAFYGDQMPSHLCEVAVTMVGSGCMVAAHRMNHTLRCRCDCHR